VAAQPAAHPSLDHGERDAEALEKRHAARLREDAAVADSFKLVVLASGIGSNLQAILDRVHMREGIEVVGVCSDKPQAPALERARAARIAASVFPGEDFPGREARDGAMGDWIEERSADLIVLAGYMQLLSASFVARFRHRIVNVHPALLPAFPGLDALGQALDAGVEVTGVTVHFVDEGVDTGPAIVQREVSVPADRDRKALEWAIHATEHELYPEAIRMIAAGRVRIDADDPRSVVIDE
jgi:phosphoribosylglycinamide formyltransferase-1